MEVSHKDDHITHAVITANETIDCKITDNSAFFHMLSSTLYSNQKEAVVREVVCNAYDAHIEAGVDLPIEITLNNGVFVVRDFGKGIHRDMIGPIYGTYGESTKKHDGKQTGGFGLGSKAPWAYTEHFQVTSEHDGVKTIYNMNRSSADAQGKPGITPIVTIPTTGSGLTVEVAVDPDDEEDFEQIINRIVINGGIKAKVNGELIQALDYPSDASFMLTEDIYSPLYQRQRILMKYGNVLYPVPAEHEAIRSLSQQVTNLLSTLSHRWFLVLLAQPHSISVTPSRESLSMQEHTIKTVQALLHTVISTFNPNKVTPLQLDVLAQALDEYAATQNFQELMPTGATMIVSDTVYQANLSKHVNTLKDFAVLQLFHRYPDSLVFMQNDIRMRWERLAHELKKKNRGAVQTFDRLVPKVVKKLGNSYYTKSPLFELLPWFHKHILGPVVRRVNRLNDSSIKVFKIANSGLNYTPRHVYVGGKKIFNHEMPDLISSRDVMHISFADALSHLCGGGVTLVHSKAEFISKRGSGWQSMIPVVVPRSEKKILAVREAFKDAKFVVDDMLELPQARVKKPNQEKEEKSAGKLVYLRKTQEYPLLSDTLLTSKDRPDFRKLAQAETGITEPSCYVHIPLSAMRDLPSYLHQDGVTLTRDVVEQFGAECAVVVNHERAKQLSEAGVPKLENYIQTATMEYRKSTPNCLKKLQENPQFLMQKIKDDRTLRGLFDKENWENLPKLVADSPSIRRHIGLPILSASTPDESFFQRMLFKYWAKVGDINSKALELDYKDSVLLPLLKELHELKLPKNVTTFLQELALSPAAQLFLDVFANKREDKQLASGSQTETMFLKFFKQALKAKE